MAGAAHFRLASFAKSSHSASIENIDIMHGHRTSTHAAGLR